MFKLILLLTGFLSLCTGLPVEKKIVAGSKIANGRKAKAQPSQVQLIHQGNFQCSGVIVNERWILTAAHCLDVYDPTLKKKTRRDANVLNIEVGTSLKAEYGHEGINVFDVETYVTHKNYDANGFHENDICLIKSKHPFYISEKVQKASFGYVNNINNATVTIAGWGATSKKDDDSIELMETDLKIVSYEECNKFWKTGLSNESQICAVPIKIDSAPCKGDSGGPLRYANNVVVGLVSYGSIGECPHTEKPDVFTKIDYYKTWIEAVINRF